MRLEDLRLSDLAQLLQLAQAPDGAACAPAPTYRRIDPPPLPEAYQGMGVDECRQRLRQLQAEASQRAGMARWSSAESREWTELPTHYRMALVLLSGIDGEIPELALRDWREMPPPERDAIRRQIRALRAALGPLRALAMRI